MKKLFLIVFACSASFIQVSSQVCTGCTQTISTSTATPLFINPGMVVCITATGTQMGPVTMSGGILCNQGSVTGSVTTTGGKIDNYGSFTSPTFSFSGGLIFTNHNIVNLGNTYTAGDTCKFYNYGGMKTGGNFTNNDSAYFYTNCMVKVNGNWANYGIMEGPSSGCGGFSVNGLASNYGSFATNNSYLDMCDSANLGGFTAQTGMLGSNTSFCTCTNFCSTSIGIEDNGGAHNSVKVITNPGKEQVMLKFAYPMNRNYDVMIYNSVGTMVVYLQNNYFDQLTIPVQGLPSDLYIYEILVDNKIILNGKFVYK